jgi:hypothetical protein
MTTIIERHSDNIRNAIAYIDEKLKTDSVGNLPKYLAEAGARFNLTPKDAEFLQIFFRDRQATI